MEIPLYYNELGIRLIDLRERGIITYDGEEQYPFLIGGVDDGENPIQLMNFAGTTVVSSGLSPRIPPGEQDNSIVLSKFTFHLTDPAYSYNIQPTVAAMKGVSLEGETVMDFGSGTGILSFIALKRQAKHAILVEKEIPLMNIAQCSAELNGIDKGKCTFIRDYIEMLGNDSYKRLVQQSTVGVANIGPHGIYGGPKGVQVKVFNTIRDYGNQVRCMVLGGFPYVPGFEPTSIIDKYRDIGFEEVRRVTVEDQKKGILLTSAVVLSR